MAALGTMSALSGQTWVPTETALRRRRDGRFHAGDSPYGYWLVRAGGRQYLARGGPGDFLYFSDQLLFAQKLAPSRPLTDAWKARLGRAWLQVNARPDFAVLGTDAGPALLVGEVPGAPGYATVSALTYRMRVVDAAHDDALGTMVLQIPGQMSRDLQDAVIERHGADEWIRCGSQLFRPADSVTELAAGASAVDVGAEGYAEWRRLPAEMTLHIAGATAWFLYDAGFSSIDSGTTLPADVVAPAGAWLLLWGSAGGNVVVTVR